MLFVFAVLVLALELLFRACTVCFARIVVSIWIWQGQGDQRIGNSFLACKLAINQPVEWRHQLNHRYFDNLLCILIPGRATLCSAYEVVPEAIFCPFEIDV
ncbi:hypothetical protein JHK82_052254 [Glycine max]|nr:hypothetical protein JHK86_052084 [Glycine max]KAG5082093.1 hypothetical protein JHK84_052131 [Glycine max]KAG5084857.1 hypothetical protein JHK82_052254 [Glycine max]